MVEKRLLCFTQNAFKWEITNIHKTIEKISETQIKRNFTFKMVYDVKHS